MHTRSFLSPSFSSICKVSFPYSGVFNDDQPQMSKQMTSEPPQYSEIVVALKTKIAALTSSENVFSTLIRQLDDDRIFVDAEVSHADFSLCVIFASIAPMPADRGGLTSQYEFSICFPLCLAASGFSADSSHLVVARPPYRPGPWSLSSLHGGPLS